EGSVVVRSVTKGLLRKEWTILTAQPAPGAGVPNSTLVLSAVFAQVVERGLHEANVSVLSFSAHGSWQKAPHGRSQSALDRPHHGPPGAVGPGDQAFVGHSDQRAIDAAWVVPVLQTPIRIGNHAPVGPEQHRPLPLLKLSNHGLSGEFA